MESVKRVAVLVYLHYHPSPATQKHATYMTWNLLPLPWDNNKLRSASLLRRHPTRSLSSSLFRVHLSVCALTEEDSRAQLSDILRGSVNVKGGRGGGGGTQRERERERGRGGWKEGDSSSRCGEDSGIVGDLFCCLVFLFPLIIPPPPPSTKEKRELTFSTGVAKCNAPYHCCHLCVCVFFLCLSLGMCVCTPLGTRQTVQTFSSQGQTRWRPLRSSHLSHLYL